VKLSTATAWFPYACLILLSNCVPPNCVGTTLVMMIMMMKPVLGWAFCRQLIPTLTESICSIFCNLGFCRLYCVEVVLSSLPLTIGMSAGPTWSEEFPIPLPERFGDLRDAPEKKSPICVRLYYAWRYRPVRAETQSWNDSEANQAAAWGSAVFFLIVRILCYVSN